MYFNQDDDSKNGDDSIKEKILISEQAATIPRVSPEENVQDAWLYQLESGVEELENYDLGDLFGFKEASKIIEKLTQDNLGEPEFMPYLFFVNNGDSYHGRSIIQNVGLEHYIKAKTEAIDDQEIESEAEEEDEGDDEEELEDQELNGKDIKEERRPPSNYRIITTIRHPQLYVPSEDVYEIIPHGSTKEYIFERILKCGSIVYDISEFPDQIEEATWVIQELEKYLDTLQDTVPKTFKKYSKIRRFILISNLLTWAKTKPIDPKEPDLPFTEADFRKRKPNEKYKEHVILEKEVLRVGKKHPRHLRTAVICVGLTYGCQNLTLHYLFKLAWKNENYLPIIGNGENSIPMFHVIDLSRLVFEIGTTLEETPVYLLAIEKEPLKQKQIVKAISKSLTTGVTKFINDEEAFLINEITQKVFDMMTINLKMQPAFIIENDHRWYADGNFIDNIGMLVKEYKTAWNLKPMKFVIHGPPLVGKTTLANKIASYFKVPFISKEQIVEDTIKDLKEKISLHKLRQSEEEEQNLRKAIKNKKNERITEEENDDSDNDDVDDDDDDDDDDEEEDANNEYIDEDENIESLEIKLNEIQQELYSNNDNLSSLTNRLIKDRLLSKTCLKQGFVMDGFPETINEAKFLFDSFEQEEEEEITKPNFNQLIMPEFVISLEAKRRELCQRLIEMPQPPILVDAKLSMQKFYNGFVNFIKSNSNEKTVLNYFDERDVYPMFFKGTIQEDVLWANLLNRVGKPMLFKQTIEEIESEREKLQNKEFERLAKEKENRKAEELKEQHDHEEKMEHWLKIMERLKQEEEEILALQGLPLRHYLMRYIFPTLTRGLIEVSRVKPADPIDFLAEFLFRENPEGKMFQPDHISCPNEIENILKEFQESLQSVKLGEFEYPEGENTNFPYMVIPTPESVISESEINVEQGEDEEEDGEEEDNEETKLPHIKISERKL